MNSRMLFFVVGTSLISTVQANDHVDLVNTIEKQTFSEVPPNPSSIALSSAPFTPADDSKGLRIDYQPFDNNFSMSAGSYQSTSRDVIAQRYNNKTWLGVGWKKMVDQARLGVRIDIGAVYKKNEGRNIAAPSTNSFKSISSNNVDETEVTRWQPVVNFGVSYRF
ncbi:hypothetical protein [uncultured Endozoicomonas sp.]|uniref:hypothetical protein n=1 Tax=uncultured Endozoicomonas sp. TaxID=432652 RepID=UPI002633293D|nr:hypothetical protein [uncultured Endozoicomonas sp.]